MGRPSKNFLILLIIAGLLILGWWLGQKFLVWWKIEKISSFQECVEAGFPILKSNPEQCQAPNGRTFTNTNFQQYIQKKFIPPSITCQNLCGDEICQTVVCQAIGCPCAETKQSCPDDCK